MRSIVRRGLGSGGADRAGRGLSSSSTPAAGTAAPTDHQFASDQPTRHSQLRGSCGTSSPSASSSYRAMFVARCSTSLPSGAATSRPGCGSRRASRRQSLSDPDLGHRADQPPTLLTVVNPQIAVPELELVQVHFHAVTLHQAGRDRSLVFPRRPHQLCRISPQDQPLAFASRLAQGSRGLELLLQESQRLPASSRLARRPRAHRQGRRSIRRSRRCIRLSPRPPPPASAGPDRSRDAVHATLGPPCGAGLAGTPRRHTLSGEPPRVRRAGTIVGIWNTDASSAQRRRPSPDYVTVIDHVTSADHVTAPTTSPAPSAARW